jgi:hypothetical protein
MKKATTNDPSDIAPSLPMMDLAEVSCPYHEIRRDVRVCEGCKWKHEETLVVHVNWQNPLLWATIAEAAVQVGIGMSPIEIVWDLQQRDLTLFWTLTPQVVGMWIDHSGDKAVWSTATLVQ